MASYAHLFTLRRLWLILTLGVVAMFSVLLFFGREIYHAAPPIPEVVRTTTGATIYTRQDIERGQAVWQSMGGMQQGSIWGHGGYLAPDWSADWLHREATVLLDARAKAAGAASFAALDARQKAAEQAVLRVDMRRNTYDPATGVISISTAPPPWPRSRRTTPTSTRRGRRKPARCGSSTPFPPTPG